MRIEPPIAGFLQAVHAEPAGTSAPCLRRPSTSSLHWRQNDFPEYMKGSPLIGWSQVMQGFVAIDGRGAVTTFARPLQSRQRSLPPTLSAWRVLSSSGVRTFSHLSQQSRISEESV